MVRFFVKRDPFSDAAGRLFQAIEHKKAVAVISAISFDPMFYVLRPSLGRQKTTSMLKKLTLKIAKGTADSKVVPHALEAGWADLKDAIQYFTAVNSDCDAVISRHKKDFKDADLPVLSPLEFLDLLNKNQPAFFTNPDASAGG